MSFTESRLLAWYNEKIVLAACSEGWQQNEDCMVCWQTSPAEFGVTQTRSALSLSAQSSMSSPKTTKTQNLCFKRAGLGDLGQVSPFSGINEATSQMVVIVLVGFSQSTAPYRRVFTLCSTPVIYKNTKLLTMLRNAARLGLSSCFYFLWVIKVDFLSRDIL